MAGGCLQRMLEILLRCHNRYSTPHFRLKYNTSDCSLYCSEDSDYSYEQTRRHHQHQDVGLILKAIIDILTQPNIHDNFEDIKQDLQTYIFIVDACRKEVFDSLHFIVDRVHYLPDKIWLQWDITCKSLIPAKLSEFLRLRQNMSSSDAKQHYVEKFRLKK